MTDRLSLDAAAEIVLTPAGDGWDIAVVGPGGDALEPGDGAAEGLLTMLGEERALLPTGWAVIRFADPPHAVGERAITVDQTNVSVVVGETLVVKWQRHVADRPHSAPAMLAHCAETGFAHTPPAFALLTWTSPAGHVLPVALVSSFLPGAQDGWDWCTEVVRRLARGEVGDPWIGELPARLGALTARLHVTLARPSHVFAHPVHRAGAVRTRRWLDDALGLLEIAQETGDDASRSVVADRSARILALLERDLGDGATLADSPIIPAHGDLHVGQILRWSGGLAVIDFDGNPVVHADTALLQPAARDVAQMTRSLDHVAQIIHRRDVDDPAIDLDRVREWQGGARDEFLDSYRAGLGEQDGLELFDERLLPAFEVEQELRELVYATRHLPDWAYAARATLQEMLPDDDRPTAWT